MIPEDESGVGASKVIAEGLSGMVRLGAAWQSVDIYYALAEAYALGEDSSLSLIARLRVLELAEGGRESLHYDSSFREAVLRPGIGGLEDPKPVEQWYKNARRAADTRHELRLIYMRERFAKGEHPDTHPDFWGDWREMELPAMPGAGLSPDQARDRLIRMGMIGVCGLLAMLIFLRWWMRKAQTGAEPAEFKIG